MQTEVYLQTLNVSESVKLPLFEHFYPKDLGVYIKDGFTNTGYWYVNQKNEKF